MSGTRLRICGAFATVLLVTVCVAATTVTEAIKQRQKEMEGVLSGMKTLGAIAKGDQPFDADVVKASAAMIADHLAQAAELFLEGSATGDVQTWAKPEIWSDRASFDEIMKSTHQAAADLQSVTEADAFPPALGKLGNGCKSCHELYRLPKQ